MEIDREETKVLLINHRQIADNINKLLNNFKNKTKRQDKQEALKDTEHELHTSVLDDNAL